MRSLLLFATFFVLAPLGTTAPQCHTLTFEQFADGELLGLQPIDFGPVSATFDTGARAYTDTDAGGVTALIANEPSSDNVLFYGGMIDFDPPVRSVEISYVSDGHPNMTAYRANGTVIDHTTGYTIGVDVGCSGDPTGNHCLWDKLHMTADGTYPIASVSIQNARFWDDLSICFEDEDPPTEEFCAGDSSCPCGNDSTNGGGCQNSTQTGARLTTFGSTGVSADDLRLQVSSMRASQSGLIYGGPGMTQLPFGDGLRCVSGSVVRFGVRQADAAGTFVEENIASQLGALPGSAWFMQAWFRDPGGPCGSGFNLSQGVGLQFVP